MAPQDGGEFRFARGDDKISGHYAALWGGVGNIMDTYAIVILNGDFLQIERCASVILEAFYIRHVRLLRENELEHRKNQQSETKCLKALSWKTALHSRTSLTRSIVQLSS